MQFVLQRMLNVLSGGVSNSKGLKTKVLKEPFSELRPKRWSDSTRTATTYYWIRYEKSLPLSQGDIKNVLKAKYAISQNIFEKNFHFNFFSFLFNTFRLDLRKSISINCNDWNFESFKNLPVSLPDLCVLGYGNLRFKYNFKVYLLSKSFTYLNPFKICLQSKYVKIPILIQ